MNAKQKSQSDDSAELTSGEELEDQTSYDQVPYHSHPFPQSHPDHIAAVARLFGLAPPAVGDCRVLELGCASGGNIIPMAEQLPDSEVVGVDLSARQIEDGRKVIKGAGLKNVQLRHASITDVDSTWGKFDYILCHGVYSWVPDDVQKKIMQICSESLSENGIAYISYNTYPGWHMRGMIRHMMCYHSEQFDKPEVRINQSRALLQFMSNSVPQQDNPHGMVLKRELDLLSRQADSYLFHEHLEDNNTPLYFYEFMQRADEQGLQYLAEADFGSMLARGFSDRTRQTLDQISNDIIRKEQYMDFLRNRPFRQTLLCHKGVDPDRNVTAEQVQSQRITISALPIGGGKDGKGPLDLTAKTKMAMRGRNGGVMYAARPITKAALMVLQENRPSSFDFEDLFQRALDRIPPQLRPNTNQVPAARSNLAQDILQGYTNRMFDFCTFDPPFATSIPEQPKLKPLAAYQAEHDGRVVSARHMYTPLGPVARKLAPLLDGSRDRAALNDQVKEWIDKGEFDPRQINLQLEPAQFTEQALTILLHLGVLEPQ